MKTRNRLLCCLLISVLCLLSVSCVPVNSGQPANQPASPSQAYVPRAGAKFKPAPAPPQTHESKMTALDGHVLNLAECIKTALDNNPATETSWQHSQAAAAGVGQADSAYLPEIDVTAGGSRGNTVNLAANSGSSAADTYAVDFSLRYLLFDGGSRRAKSKGAKAALLNADFRHNTTLQDVALKVEEAYYQLLTARELERVAVQTVRQTKYHVDLAQARHQNGIAARSDVLKAQTAKADAYLQLVRVKSQVRIIRGQLANAMGLPPAASFALAELPPNPQTGEAADIKRLMDEAVGRRPELSAALADMAGDRAKIKAAKARYWPMIFLNSNYGLRDRTFIPSRDEWSIGLGLSLPLFDGFDREYTIQETQANLAAATSSYKTLRHDIELEVWTAYSQLSEAAQAISAAQTMVASAEESARVTEGEYKNGSASIIGLIDAQTARTSANVQLAQSRFAWYIARAGLERAVGRSLAR